MGKATSIRRSTSASICSRERRVWRSSTTFGWREKKVVEDLSQDAGLAGRAEPERKVPDLSVPRLAGRRHGVVGVLEDAAHLLEEGSARLRECDEMSRPVEESHSEFAFEVLDLMGQGGCEMWSFSAARPK